MNRGSHPRARTSAQDAPSFRRPLAALLTSLGSLFSPLGWFFHLATADTTATLHLPSIPLHAPLVELGWRQRGRPLEPNDLVSLRFNGEIRCCRDNGRSAPEVKDNDGGLRRQGSVLAPVRDANPRALRCHVLPKCDLESGAVFVQPQRICGSCSSKWFRSACPCMSSTVGSSSVTSEGRGGSRQWAVFCRPVIHII